MIVYNFKCNDCEEIYEVWCKMSEREDSHPCENCESSNTEHVIIAFGGFIQSKGSGRKVNGELGKRLKDIDNYVGRRSTISDSVDLSKEF